MSNYDCSCYYEVDSGSTAVLLPKAILDAIVGVAQIIPSVTVPGQGLFGPADGLYAVFPASGGHLKLSEDSVSKGEIKHKGGLRFTGKIEGQDANLKIKSFKIKLDTGLVSADAKLTVGCNKQKLGRVDVFQLGGVTISRDDDDVTGAAEMVKLTATAASVLNQLAAEPIFEEGLSVGSASFVVDLCY